MKTYFDQHTGIAVCLEIDYPQNTKLKWHSVDQLLIENDMNNNFKLKKIVFLNVLPTIKNNEKKGSFLTCACDINDNMNVHVSKKKKTALVFHVISVCKQRTTMIWLLEAQLCRKTKQTTT